MGDLKVEGLELIKGFLVDDATVVTSTCKKIGPYHLQPVPGDSFYGDMCILFDLSKENRVILENLFMGIDPEYNSISNVNFKDPDTVWAKVNRPSFKEKYPDLNVSAVRDALRAKILADDLTHFPNFFDYLGTNSDIRIVKVDTSHIVNPNLNGWRFAAFDLLMPNGQIVEMYIIPKEIQWAKRGKGHLVYEQLRGKRESQMIRSKKKVGSPTRQHGLII